MAKGNIRSMRFSDQIIEMIESQVGDTFTAKFEALVTRCMWELPEKERQLAEIKERIEIEKQNLRYIRDRKQRMENHMRNLEYSAGNLKAQMDRIIKDMEEM